MTVRFDTFFTDYTRHFADAASRANRLALESAESALDVQLRVFESNTTATADFFGELTQGGANVPADDASDTFHVPFLKLIRSLMPLPSASPASCGSVTMFGLIRSTCETSEFAMPPEKPSCW